MNQTVSTALSSLVVAVGVVAIYHLVFHAGGGPARQEDPGSARYQELVEREIQEMEDMLRRSEAVLPPSLDLNAMGALLKKAGVELGADVDRNLLLSLWYSHLQGLQRNLREAIDAARANEPARGGYRVKATQMIGTFHRKLKEGMLNDEQARKLFTVVPAMVPPPVATH